MITTNKFDPLPWLREEAQIFDEVGEPGAFEHGCKMTAAADELTRLRAENAELRQWQKTNRSAIARASNAEADNAKLQSENENLSCGHRKRDCDDSYGGCCFCQALTALKEEDDEADRLRAECAELREALTDIVRQRTERLMRKCDELRSDDSEAMPEERLP